METVESVKNWWQGLPDRIYDAVSNLWNRAGEAFNNFKNSAINWAQDTANSIVSWFTNLPSRISGSVTSGITSWWNSLKAGIESGRSQEGGFIRGNESRIVGEAGPEVFVPSQSGTVIPNSRLSGGTIVNIYGTVYARDENEIASFVGDLSRQLSLAKQGV